MQHLEESFSSKCFPLVLLLPGWDRGSSSLVISFDLLSFLAGAFPETRQLAEEAVCFQRVPQGIVGSGTDPRVAWTFPEIMAAAEARLRVLSEQMGRLSEAGMAMTEALWPDSVAPNSFTWLPRW